MPSRTVVRALAVIEVTGSVMAIGEAHRLGASPEAIREALEGFERNRAAGMAAEGLKGPLGDVGASVLHCMSERR